MAGRTIISKHWDRIITYVCFGGYGVISMSRPTASLASMPFPFAFLFNLELILASILLILSLFYDRIWLRVAGYTVYAFGMLTIAALIALRSGAPVWVLILGFAFQGLVSIRYLNREKAIGQQLAQVVEQLKRPNDGS